MVNHKIVRYHIAEKIAETGHTIRAWHIENEVPEMRFYRNFTLPTLELYAEKLNTRVVDLLNMTEEE